MEMSKKKVFSLTRNPTWIEFVEVEVVEVVWKCLKKGIQVTPQSYLDRIRGSGSPKLWKSWKYGSRGSGSRGSVEVVEVSKFIPINFVEVAEISETKRTYGEPDLF